MDTYLTVAGNLVADPVQRLTASGISVVGFRVASSGRRFDKPSGEFRDGETSYMTVSCWRGLGGNVLASLRKGDSVVVFGRLIYRSYDDRQGVRRSVHELDAISVGPDLARCPADLRRPQRPAVAASEADGVPATSHGAGPAGSEPDASEAAPTTETLPSQARPREVAA
jgi:single-strand DNA-binding protein